MARFTPCPDCPIGWTDCRLECGNYPGAHQLLELTCWPATPWTSQTDHGTPCGDLGKRARLGPLWQGGRHDETHRVCGRVRVLRCSHRWGKRRAATSKSAFLVFVEPTISASSTGLTLETEFEGSFNVADRTASGGGEYSVMD